MVNGTTRRPWQLPSGECELPRLASSGTKSSNRWTAALIGTLTRKTGCIMQKFPRELRGGEKTPFANYTSLCYIISYIVIAGESTQTCIITYFTIITFKLESILRIALKLIQILENILGFVPELPSQIESSNQFSESLSNEFKYLQIYFNKGYFFNCNKVKPNHGSNFANRFRLNSNSHKYLNLVLFLNFQVEPNQFWNSLSNEFNHSQIY